MSWHKRAHLYSPAGNLWWARSHAHLPTVEMAEPGVIRVYFAALDEHKFGRIGFVDLDSDRPERVIRAAEDPVLDLGELGAFDDSGVVPSCIINVGGAKLLYYIGFQRSERVPYMLFTGVALATSSGSFVRHCRVPILDRTEAEPFSRSAPCILLDNMKLKMWYWSCVRWVRGPAGVHYYNVIRYAESDDGFSWITDPHVAIEPAGPDEFSIGRPSVIVDGSGYRMWYSVRSFSKRYSIGYAESDDGIHWVRKDQVAGMERSADGWDSEMVCYPAVAKIGDELHMFYNGNQHGATGFGHAVFAP